MQNARRLADLAFESIAVCSDGTAIIIYGVDDDGCDFNTRSIPELRGILAALAPKMGEITTIGKDGPLSVLDHDGRRYGLRRMIGERVSALQIFPFPEGADVPTKTIRLAIH